jgi:hypothetical protein
MLSTVSSEMAQKVLNGVRKNICRSWLGKSTVYKIKIVFLFKSTNKNFINSHLLWLKYFLLITFMTCVVNMAAFATKNCSSRGLGLQCGFKNNHSKSCYILKRKVLDLCSGQCPFIKQ